MIQRTRTHRNVFEEPAGRYSNPHSALRAWELAVGEVGWIADPLAEVPLRPSCFSAVLIIAGSGDPD